MMSRLVSMVRQGPCRLAVALTLGAIGLSPLAGWAEEAPEGKQPQDQAGFVSDKFIFSAVEDPSVEGEGFFAELNGKSFAVVSTFQDNPHDLENTRRMLATILRGGVHRLSLPATKPMDAFVEYKTNLGMEHRLLNEATMKFLAAQVRLIGPRHQFECVYYKDIRFAYEPVIFPCRTIESVGDIVMTTGGSVWVFPVHFSDGSEDLHLGLGTVTEDGWTYLSSFRDKVLESIGSDRQIVADEPQLLEVFYTTCGPRSGWVAGVSKVWIE